MEPIRIVNLTPHDIRIVRENGDVVLPRSGRVARLKTQQLLIDDERLPFYVVVTRLLGIEDLPDPEPYTLYVTSSLVAQAAARYGRNDVLAPDTGPESAVRDESGQIVGVRRLQRFE